MGLVCGSKMCLPAILGHLPTDVCHIYSLRTRVVKTIIAVADSIWDAGGQKKKFVGASNAAAVTRSVTQFESLLGRQPP